MILEESPRAFFIYADSKLFQIHITYMNKPVHLNLYYQGIFIMNTFKLNPMLVQALSVTQTYENGFIIKHYSESTDMSPQLIETINTLLARTLEGIPCPNLVHEAERINFGTVKFLCGPKDIYDITDWDVIKTYIQSILKELEDARAFI